MTTEAIAAHLHRVLPEFLEGYVIVGVSAQDGTTIARYWFPDPEACARINGILAMIQKAGGVPMSTEPTEPDESCSTTNN